MQSLHEQVARVLENDPTLLAQTESKLAADVDGAQLVRDIQAFITNYVMLPRDAALPLALWALLTHMFDLFDAVPYLVIKSPVPRCGKTRLLECLELIVAEPRRASNISEAAFFRSIDAFRPTLILDEAETLNNQKSERSQYLLQILNAGNRRGAVTTRCIGQGANTQVKDFSVFCPKIVAGIGSFPATVTDRAIVIEMQRRKNSEPVARFLYRTVEPVGRALRKRSESFSAGRSAIGNAYEQVDLQFLSDRDAEAWAPLFAILAVADPGRLGELRKCAEQLSKEKGSNAEDDSLALRLLADLRAIWTAGERHMLTAEILNHLKTVEDGPWASEVELDSRKLSRMLKPFGVRPGDVRTANGRGKGYIFEELELAFSRYLGSNP